MRTIFEQFGPVLDVVARKTYRLRGQAWVVFERAEDAEKAVKLLQGFPFYSKQLVGGAVGSALLWAGGMKALHPGACSVHVRLQGGRAT